MPSVNAVLALARSRPPAWMATANEPRALLASPPRHAGQVQMAAVAGRQDAADHRDAERAAQLTRQVVQRGPDALLGLRAAPSVIAAVAGVIAAPMPMPSGSRPATSSQ